MNVDMAILNYTTKIKTEKTASEIQSILGKSGAQAVMSEFEDGEVSAISFRIAAEGQMLSFRLPVNTDGVLRAIKRDCPRNHFKNEAQAKRTAWRIIKDWVEAQTALVEANQADIIEVFLPYLQDDKGITVYHRLKSGGFKLLSHDK
jgi:hypothetical protein